MATRVMLILVLATMLASAQASSQFDRRRSSIVAGGWKPVDPSDPEVKALGKFAVAEHNKELGSRKLEFSKVVTAMEQVVAGTMYSIKLEVAGASNKLWEARVWVKEWQNFKRLMKFVPVQA